MTSMSADSVSGILEVRIEGETIQPGKVAIRDLTQLTDLIQAGLERVARVLSGEPGTAPGPLPAPLRRATGLLLTGIRPGSATLLMELPAAVSEPDEREGQLFEPGAIETGVRAMERLVTGLHELEKGNPAVPEGWDNSVMEVAEDLAQLVTTRNVELDFDAKFPRKKKSRARIVPELAPRFAVRHAPIRRRRVARGELIAVDLRKGRIDVEDATGRRVACQFDPESNTLMGTVKRLVGQVVVVAGEEEFDAALNRSGRLEVQELGEASTAVPLGDMFWEERTAAEHAREQQVSAVETVDELASTVAFDEGEYEAFLEALRETRSPE